MSHFIELAQKKNCIHSHAGHPHMYLITLEYCDVLIVFDALLSRLFYFK